jgi:hypothetical protein
MNAVRRRRTCQDVFRRFLVAARDIEYRSSLFTADFEKIIYCSPPSTSTEQNKATERYIAEMRAFFPNLETARGYGCLSVRDAFTEFWTDRNQTWLDDAGPPEAGFSGVGPPSPPRGGRPW